MSISGREAARGRKTRVKTPTTMRREPSLLDTKVQVQKALQAPLRRHSFRQFKVIYQSLKSMKMKSLHLKLLKRKIVSIQKRKKSYSRENLSKLRNQSA